MKNNKKTSVKTNNSLRRPTLSQKHRQALDELPPSLAPLRPAVELLTRWIDTKTYDRPQFMQRTATFLDAELTPAAMQPLTLVQHQALGWLIKRVRTAALYWSYVSERETKLLDQVSRQITPAALAAASALEDQLPVQPEAPAATATPGHTCGTETSNVAWPSKQEGYHLYCHSYRPVSVATRGTPPPTAMDWAVACATGLQTAGLIRPDQHTDTVYRLYADCEKEGAPADTGSGGTTVDRTEPRTSGETPVDTNPMRQLLEGAIAATCGDRNRDYGNPEDDLECTAKLWEAYINRRLQRQGKADRITLQGQDVSVMMVLVKTSRLANSPDHEDSWKDTAGYAATGWRCSVVRQPKGD